MVEKANNSNSLIYSIKIALIIIATLDNSGHVWMRDLDCEES